MASTYRTKRYKIVEAYVEQLKGINGQSPYNSNLFNEVHGVTLFIDQISQFPSVCVIAGDETREYQPDGFKWRYLNMEIRIYVSDEENIHPAIRFDCLWSHQIFNGPVAVIAPCHHGCICEEQN